MYYLKNATITATILLMFLSFPPSDQRSIAKEASENTQHAISRQAFYAL